MQIYVGHSTQFNYQKELYLPIQQSLLWQQHTFILPHIASVQPFNTKSVIQHCDLFIAEVSYPSTGLGIELGWADMADRNIIGIYQKGRQFSSSLNIICGEFIEYESGNGLMEKLKEYLAVKYPSP